MHLSSEAPRWPMYPAPTCLTHRSLVFPHLCTSSNTTLARASEDIIESCSFMMDSGDLLDFASISIIRVAQIATALGVQKRKPRWGFFGGMLMQAEGHLDDHGFDQEARINKLLRGVESMCTLSLKVAKNEFPLLEAIYHEIPGSSEYTKAENNIRQGLFRRTLIDEAAVEDAIRHIKRFIKKSGTKRHENGDDGDLPIKTDAPICYPDEVNILVSNIVRDQMCCTCSHGVMQTTQGKHLTQLMLRPPLPKTLELGHVRFDMLFSTVPVYNEYHFSRWQTVELQVYWSKKQSKKRTRFLDNDPSSPLSQSSEELIQISEEQFCKALSLYPDSRVRLIAQDGKFQGSRAVKPIEKIIQHKPGISLARILRDYSLTPKMRVALAYILAYSVWQYYDSDWIRARWTSESIQFMKEDDNSTQTEGKLFAWKPYLSVRFGDEAPGLQEYSNTYGEMHRYPKPRALGILLVEIGIGIPLDETTQHPLSDKTNADWLWAMERLKNEKYWRALDYSSYRRAVDNCLNPENFFSASHMEGGGPGDINGLKQRREILYQKVVAPLEKLLKGTGWMDELTTIGPLETPVGWNDHPVGSMQALELSAKENMPSSQSTDKACLTRSQREAKKWLSRINALNMSLKASRGSFAPIRIAILDTGCNREAAFLLHPRNSHRLKGWKDFVRDSQEWQDHDGHGTYLTSLMMKIAPEVEIYIARIVESSADLLLSSENVAKAISWASNECNVDIISMSFGFAEEQPCISRAIHEALSHRDGSILFFSAASNYGANEREMFPARHESVISIRATNFNGDFLDLNPPRNHNEGVVFGTLGLDVPSEPGNDGKIIYQSGTSVATAIAAGIAGSVLGYVSTAMDKTTFEQVNMNLRARQGTQALFEALSRSSQNDQHLYLAPWKLEGLADETRWSIIESAIFNR